jgi:hypothetical protein
MQQVQNPTRIPKTIPIVRSDGTKDEIFVQPGAKVTLPAGAKVSNSFTERDGSVTILNKEA